MIDKSRYRQCVHCGLNYLPHKQTARRQRTCGRERCVMKDSKVYQLSRPEPKSFTPDDLAIVKAAWSTPRKRSAFHLMADSGLRVGELVTLNVDDVRRPNGDIRPHFTLSAERTKTNRHRSVLVSPEGQEAIAALVADRTTGPLFLSQRTGLRLGVRGVQKWLEPVQGKLSEYRTIHGLRHTAIYKAAGVDIRLAQRLAGHADLNMTQRYATMRDADAHEALFGA